MKLELSIIQRVEKRIFDFVLSSIAIILLIPVYLVIAILIKLDSKGQIIYKQKRVGRKGKIFRIYKFRTMIQNAEQQSGPILEKTYDNRLTQIGAILRKTKLDGIPQFINVLLGSMSIVGPRPERPFLLERIKQHYKEFELRELVKPGITSLACIQVGYYASPQEKMKYDLQYMQNWKLSKDIVICIKTIEYLLKQIKA